MSRFALMAASVAGLGLLSMAPDTGGATGGTATGTGTATTGAGTGTDAGTGTTVTPGAETPQAGVKKSNKITAYESREAIAAVTPLPTGYKRYVVKGADGTEHFVMGRDANAAAGYIALTKGSWTASNMDSTGTGGRKPSADNVAASFAKLSPEERAKVLASFGIQPTGGAATGVAANPAAGAATNAPTTVGSNAATGGGSGAGASGSASNAGKPGGGKSDPKKK